MKSTLPIIAALSASAIAAPLRIVLSKDVVEHMNNKRAENDLSSVEAFNYIFQLEQSSAGVTAYENEFAAVENPADVLG
jgi:hypothetical protein